MKKVLVCALAALFLMASCLTAIAAPAFETTTIYTLAPGAAPDATNVKITSTVTSAGTDEMITYLAYTGAEPTDSTIKYIDQKDYVVGNTNFTYDVTHSEYVNLTVKSGSSTSDAAQEIPENADDRIVTLNVVGGGEVALITAELGSEVGTGAIATGYTIDSNYKIDSITVAKDGATATDLDTANYDATAALVLKDGEHFNGKNNVVTLTISEKETEVPAAVVEDTGSMIGWAFKDDDGIEKLIVFGKVSAIPTFNEENYKDICGAYIDTNNAPSTEYAAYDVSETNKQFAIQLVDEDKKNDSIINNNWWAQIYAKNSKNEVTKGAVVQIHTVE